MAPGKQPFALLAVLLLAGCGSGWAPGWLAVNVHERSYDNHNPPPGFPDYIRSVAAFSVPVAHDVWRDDDCSLEGICLANTGDPAFVMDHERGHVAYSEYLGSPMGTDHTAQERGANCIAEVILGRARYGQEYRTDAYWNCPADWVEFFGAGYERPGSSRDGGPPRWSVTGLPGFDRFPRR